MTRDIERHRTHNTQIGPVITIARQYGCYSTEIARELAKEISKNSSTSWNYLTNLILEESARELDVSQDEIAHLFGANDKGFFSNIIESFTSNNYRSDSMIINTISSVVRKYAEQGNVIIVGRAGCTITKDIKKTLHVKIVAPFEYRVGQIQKRFNLSKTDATSKVKDIDKDRQRFMSFFRETRENDEIFEMFLNREKMSTDEIVSAIAHTAQIRGFY